MVVYLLLVMLFIIIILMRSYFARKKNISEALFAEALRNENSGNYKEAIITYENALVEARKPRFRPDTRLKNCIIEKLKVLHTAMAYEQNFTYSK